MNTATTLEEEKTAVAMSPAKNRSTLAKIPTQAVSLLNVLLRSMTMEIIKAAISSALRPAVAVARNKGMPKKGKAAAIGDQILLVFLSPRYKPKNITQNKAMIVTSMRLMTFRVAETPIFVLKSTTSQLS
jgi:hypothetical protein